jgi:UDP-N-acetylglucosamine transferase subunit ALG13
MLTPTDVVMHKKSDWPVSHKVLVKTASKATVLRRYTMRIVEGRNDRADSIMDRLEIPITATMAKLAAAMATSDLSPSVVLQPARQVNCATVKHPRVVCSARS